MTVNGSDECAKEIDQVLNRHRDWLRHMPWATTSQQSAESYKSAMRTWIDEFGDEFHEASTPLSTSVNMVACCNRILTLLSGPCQAFVQGATSASVTYRRVREVLLRASGAMSAENSFDDVRDTFRQFGRNDGVRHCVLASAVEVGHERAIKVFLEEFDGVRRQLAASFSERLGEEVVNEVWQDVSTDLVFGEGASS